MDERVAKMLANETRTLVEEACRTRARSVYLGNRTALCRVLGLYHCFVSTEDEGLAPHLMLDGYWEMWVTQAIARFVKPGMRCIDVGANAGYFTLLCADLVEAGGHVQAWEPQPACADLIRRSTSANGFENRVSIINAAAGRVAGTATLNVPSGKPMNASVLGERMRSTKGVSYEVALGRLDDRNVLPVNFVKIDSEGCEPEVWDGMQALLDRSGRDDQPFACCMEFSPHRYPDPAAFLKQIRDAGFEVRLVGFDANVSETTDALLLAEERMIWITRKR